LDVNLKKPLKKELGLENPMKLDLKGSKSP
jgi:hypothetical protein